jgi:hypothetical protein
MEKGELFPMSRQLLFQIIASMTEIGLFEPSKPEI